MTLRDPMGLIHIEMFRSVGEASWARSDVSIPFPIGAEWPRCFACEVTDDHAIIPAFAVTGAGTPVCLAHVCLGGMSWTSLRPPCAICGVVCTDRHGCRAFSVGGVPVVGYLCVVHAGQGIAIPRSQKTWGWNPDVPTPIPLVEYARVSAWSVSRDGEYEGEVYKFDDGTEYTGRLWGVR